MPSEPIDVTKQYTFDFVTTLYGELDHLVVDDWIHIGGDEVSLDCWNRSSSVQTWMIDHNMTHVVQLYNYFEQFLFQTVSRMHKRSIVWQEIFDSGMELPSSTIVDVWKSWNMTAREKASLRYDVLVSACWYLDYWQNDWWDFYHCDIRDFNGTEAQKSHIVGGHASMWGERVDETNFMPQVWPRTCATAEKLWTGNLSSATHSSHERLERHRCRMVQLGFAASPISPGTCETAHSPQSSVL